MGRFLPPDHSAGDANTVGGYHAVHQRPAAFEGKDGASYSVEIVVDDGVNESVDAPDPRRPFGAYLMFVRWRHGDPVAEGHLESAYLVRAATEESARNALGAMPLNTAKQLLDKLIDVRARPERPWYEAMQDEGDDV